jgi:hypothetical protein
MGVCGKKFSPFFHVSCKIITFEVKGKDFLGPAQDGQHSLTQLYGEGGTIQKISFSPLTQSS